MAMQNKLTDFAGKALGGARVLGPLAPSAWAGSASGGGGGGGGGGSASPPPPPPPPLLVLRDSEGEIAKALALIPQLQRLAVGKACRVGARLAFGAALLLALAQAPAIANGLTDADRRLLLPAEDASQPQPIREGQRVLYVFGASQARLVCAPLRVCLIELERGERIAKGGLHLGDTHRWGVQAARGGDKVHLVVKPVAANLRTTATIITDRRTYYVDLVSDEEAYMPAIGWVYPQGSALPVGNGAQQESGGGTASQPDSLADLSTLDFGFLVSGCNGCSWRPSRVYTDGQQTVIQLPAEAMEGELPALLAVGAGGEAALVNYRVHGNRYVVDAVLSEAALVAGAGGKRARVVIRRAQQ